MNGALATLLFLRFRGGIRHRLRQLLSPSGFVIATVLAFVFWGILQADPSAAGIAGKLAFQHDSGSARAAIVDYMPIGLFLAFLFNVFGAAGSAFQYSQVEVDFLLAGPFRHRDLVIYKCITFLAGMLITAVLILALAPSRTVWPPAAFAGALFAPMFLQLSGAFLRMSAQLHDVAWLKSLRRPAIVFLFFVPPLILATTLVTGIGILDCLSYFRDSAVGQVLLLPFAVFTHIFLAKELFPDLALWIFLAAGINTALLAAVIYLDRQSGDRHLSETTRSAKRWARLKRGGSFLAGDETTARSLRKPAYLAGVGPIVWRQAINASRNVAKVVVVFVAIGMLTGPLIANARDLNIISLAFGLIFLVVVFIMPRALLCDFRGDWDSLELYRSLPLAPWRICAGQLVVPVVLASFVQAVMVISTMPFFDEAARFALQFMLLYLIPLNMLLYGIENLVFLLFPTRILPVGRVDFEFMGRTLLEFSLKAMLLALIVGLAVRVGFSVRDATGQSYLWMVISSWGVLTAMALAMIPLNAMAFRNFRIDQTIAP